MFERIFNLNLFKPSIKGRIKPNGLLILYFLHADLLDENWLGRLRASLRSLIPLPKGARFCLADYSSQPCVPRSLLREFSTNYYHCAAPLPFNRSWSINHAYKRFKNNKDKYLLFTDIDLVFPPNFLDSALALSGDKNAIVIPSVFYLHQKASNVDLPYAVLRREIDSAWRQFFGGACLCPTRLYEKVRGFDEKYVGWGAEDNDFINKIESVDGEVIKSEKLEVLHLDHPRIGEENKVLVKRNRERLARKERGEIVMIGDSPWGEKV